MTWCQACQGSCVTSSQERLNTKNWVNTGIIVRATGNVFCCFMSEVTSEISIRYSQIVTGTRTTMHHSRKIDFLISFHNSDARARLTRFHLSQVRKLSEAQQAVAPLRQKSRQFIARNLELSARNRELESASVSSSSSVKRERQTQGRGSRSSSTNKLKSRILLGKVSFTQFCDFQQSIKIGVC